MYFSRPLAGMLLLVALFQGGASLCGRRPSLLLSARGLAFPCPSTEAIYREAGKLQPKNIIITRAQMLHDDVFAVVPRYKPGVPFTLAKTNLKSKSFEAELTPFPNWDLQQVGKCDSIQSAVDLFLDHKHFLWVLDDGVVNSLTKPQAVCTPKVVGIDAKTGKVMQMVDLLELVEEHSRLQYIIADHGLDGKVRLFITDAGTRAILIVDAWSGNSRRLSLPPPPSIQQPIATATSPCRLPPFLPASAHSPVAASTFSAEPGHTSYSSCSDMAVPTTALYAALVSRNGKKTLIISALGDPILYALNLAELDDEEDEDELEEIGLKPKGKDIVFLGTDGHRTLFFRYVGQSQIMSWNADRSFTSSEITVAAGSKWSGPESAIPSQVLVGDISLWSLDAPLRQYLEDKISSIGPTTKLHQLGVNDDSC